MYSTEKKNLTSRIPSYDFRITFPRFSDLTNCRKVCYAEPGSNSCCHRPGCENLDRDVTVNTNYGRVNGFYVYLYDGPRTPLYSRYSTCGVYTVKKECTQRIGGKVMYI
jgi:hypothetical protein